jgi:hypothetical protein
MFIVVYYNNETHHVHRNDYYDVESRRDALNRWENEMRENGDYLNNEIVNIIEI